MTNMNQITHGSRMPLWKWLLLLVGGFIGFLLVYAILQGAGRITPVFWASATIIISASALILGLYAGFVRLFEKRCPSELTIRKAPVNLALGLLTGFSYFAVVTGIMSLSGAYAGEFGPADTKGIILSFLYYLIIASGEEVLFRGILFRMIDERFNTWIALAISALLFGFIHMGQPNATVWSSVAIAIEAGLMLGLAYKCSGTLWLPIGIHWAWNFTEENVFGFAVSGTAPNNSLIHPVVSGPDMVTSGSFGPEASVIAVALGLLVSMVFLRLSIRDK